MRRRFKLLAVVIGVPAVLVLAAAMVLPMLADSVHYKGELSALVKERTGRDLYIDGNVRLRLFPQLHLTVTDVRLANPPGFSSPDFARLPWLAVDVKLLPLLAGRVEPRAIVVTGLHLYLERDRQGRGNWESPSIAEQDSAVKQQTPSSTPLAVGELDVRDATLHWRDQASGETVTLPAINLQTGVVRGDKGIDDVRLQLRLPQSGTAIDARGDVALGAMGDSVVMAKLTATFQHPGAAGMQFDGTLGTGLKVDLQKQYLSLENLSISARGTGSDEEQITVEIAAELGFDLAGQRLLESAVSATVPSFSLSGISGNLALKGVLTGDLGAGTYGLENMRGSGNVGGKGTVDSNVVFSLAGALNGDLAMGKFSARGLTVDASIDGNSTPLRLEADLDISPRAQTLTATAMHLSIQDWRVDGAMTLRAAASPAGLQGVLDLRIQDQPIAGSFGIIESEAHAGSVDVGFDLVADLDLEDGGYVPRGRHAMVMRARVTPESADGSWHIDDVNLGARLADASFPDGKLTIRLQADLAVNVSRQSVRSDNLQVTIDDSRIVGSVNVQRFGKPAVQVDLQADSIDADRYLLPVSGRTGGSAAATPVDASIEAIRALDFAGEVRVQTLILRGLELKDVRLTSDGAVSGG